MPLRIRALLVGAVTLVIILVWFLFGWSPRQARIRELQSQQQQVRTETANLRARLLRLQRLRDDAPRLQAELARLQDALPGDPRLPDFILQLHQTASLAGIEFLSISPSLPSGFSPPAVPGAPSGAAGGLQAISLSIATTGKFFALEDFIVRMERLQRAIRINSFGLSPSASEVPGGSPSMAVTFQMQMFLVPGSSAPVVAPTPTPAGSPGTSPTPAATGAP